MRNVYPLELLLYYTKVCFIEKSVVAISLFIIAELMEFYLFRVSPQSRNKGKFSIVNLNNAAQDHFNH